MRTALGHGIFVYTTTTNLETIKNRKCTLQCYTVYTVRCHAVIWKYSTVLLLLLSCYFIKYRPSLYANANTKTVFEFFHFSFIAGPVLPKSVNFTSLPLQHLQPNCKTSPVLYHFSLPVTLFCSVCNTLWSVDWNSDTSVQIFSPHIRDKKK